ncbi:hypothetical protein PC128_g19002 [Phytophthora cactorum]|nr:hypothetical protein PC128_g19002 [Phytophthora cactorum]
MAAETDTLALQQVSVLPSQIWEQVRQRFDLNEMARGLPRDQVIRQVYRVRRVHFGGSVHGHVEVPPPLSQSRDGSNFFQFNFTYADVSLFVDGTFFCVPSSFY